MKEATAIRETEATELNFAAEEKASKEVVDMIQRAVTILEKGGGASMMQRNSQQRLKTFLSGNIAAIKQT